MSDGRPEQPGAWLHDLASQTSGKVRVRLSTDWFVDFPVEVAVNGYPGYVRPSMLGISDALTRDLESFQQWWQVHAGVDDAAPDDATTEDPGLDEGWSRWQREGQELIDRLQSELGPACDVVWIGDETE